MNSGLFCRATVVKTIFCCAAFLMLSSSAFAQTEPDLETDCDNNGIPDICDVCFGDFCEIVCPDICDGDDDDDSMDNLDCYQGNDCNNNGQIDECEDDGLPACTFDCDNNNVPDVCELDPLADIETCSAVDVNREIPPVSGTDFCEDAPFAHRRVTSSWHTGSLFFKTRDGDSMCDDSDDEPDVWFRYHPTQDGTVRLTTRTSSTNINFDTVMSVHTGCPNSGGMGIACSDDFSSSDPRAEVTISVTANTTYWVRVSRKAGEFRTFFGLGIIPTPDDTASAYGGTRDDCNTDGVPDNCQFEQFGDCNFNDILDTCEIEENPFFDFNDNAVIDECEDCNGNFVPDICEIEGYDLLPLPAPSGSSCFVTLEDGTTEVGSFCDCFCMNDQPPFPEANYGENEGSFFMCGQTPDCNSDLNLDLCQADCNNNDIPDDCDISDQTSLDCQLNEIPDECDLASHLVSTGSKRSGFIFDFFRLFSGPDDFFIVNQMTGGDTFIGPIGAVLEDSEFGAVLDVAISPMGMVYALATNFIFNTQPGFVPSTHDNPFEQSVWQIDPLTGMGTLVTTLTEVEGLTGLTFGSDGTLYAIGPQSEFDVGFVSIDLITGAVNTISDDADVSVGGYGMATNAAGQIFSVEEEFFFNDNCPKGIGDCFCDVEGYGGCGEQFRNILQLHDPTTGDVIASAEILDGTVLNNPDCNDDEESEEEDDGDGDGQTEPPFTDTEYGGHNGKQNSECQPRYVFDIAFGDDGQLYAIVERRTDIPPFILDTANVSEGGGRFRELAIINFDNFTLMPVEDPSAVVDPTVGPISDILNYIGGPIPPRSNDCNGTGIPDECEIMSGMALDCNLNQVPDSCDLENEEAFDCNLNEIPDECDLDCDLNEIPDDCEIAEDPTLDCNLNEQLDICEEGPDCNDNSIPDECELDSDGDELIDDCDLCPNDPNKTDEGQCGCGVSDEDLNDNGIADCNDVDEPTGECQGLCSEDNPDFDEDNDGNSNCQEIADQTDPCDPGSFIERLEPLACTGVNFFFDQINITTVKNHSAETLTAVVTYRDLLGIVQGSVTVVLNANEKRDIIVNELGAKADEYGTVCVDTDAEVNGAWSGGTLILNPASAAEAQKRANGVAFDYALYYEFTNPRTGTVQVPLNTNILGDGGIGSTANWVRLTDAVPDDGKGLFGVIDYYDAVGKLITSEPVGIPDGGRQDFDAHLAVGQDVVGIAEFTPTDGSSSYYVETTRYQYRGSFGSAQENFFTAYTIPNRPITAAMLTGQVTTTPSELAIVEVINGSDDESVANLDVFSSDGVAAQSNQPFSIPSKGSNHTVVTGNILTAGTSGSAELSSLTNGGLSAITLLYGFDNGGNLLFGFAPPFVESAGGVQRTEFNSFLGHKNFLQLRNSADEALDANVVVFDPVGTILLNFNVSVAPRETEQVELAVPANTYGTVVVSTDGGKVGLVVQNNVTLVDQYVIPYPGR